MTQRRAHLRDAAFRSSAVELLHAGRLDSGRALAFLVLQQHDTTGRFVTDLMADLDSKHTLSRRERSQAIDVVAGVLRRRRTIDVLLESQVNRSRVDVEPDLWRIIQIGVQQLCFGRTPDHAAIDATVELTRTLNRPRWSGFANGVLRNITRLLTDQYATKPARHCVPLPTGEYRELNSDVFSCPLTAAVEYFGEAFSMPRAIARRWHQRMKYSDLLIAGFHSITPPTTGMRVNVLKTTVSNVAEALDAANVMSQPGATDESLRLKSAGRIEMLPGFADGHWTIQDDSAMLPARMLNPQAGEVVLDLCAAPGGKTTHLAEISGDRATIYATDVSDERLQLVNENVDRLQLSSVRSRLIDHHGGGLPDVEFDAALVDVPCSNTGVLSRRPEARWRFREKAMEELVQLQTRLLMTAFDRLRPGGRLVYSTCSIEPEETTNMIRSVVQVVPSMRLQHDQVWLPGQPADGAYAALLVRAAAGPPGPMTVSQRRAIR